MNELHPKSARHRSSGDDEAVRVTPNALRSFPRGLCSRAFRPLLPFEIGLMNGQETRGSGLQKTGPRQQRPSSLCRSSRDPRYIASKAETYLTSARIGDRAYFGPDSSTSSSTKCITTKASTTAITRSTRSKQTGRRLKAAAFRILVSIRRRPQGG